jgi:hypothetical protein
MTAIRRAAAAGRLVEVETAMQFATRLGRVAGIVAALLAPGASAEAAESGFTIYPLGSLAFGAGSVPPPGLYVTPVAYYYQGRTGAALPVSGVTAINVEVSLFSPSVNLTWSPQTTLLGGQPAVTLGLPAGYIDLAADAVGGITGAREVSARPSSAGRMATSPTWSR